MSKPFRIRPKNDFIVVEVEPLKEYSRGGIIKVAPEPIRTGYVRAVGPGRYYRNTDSDKETFVPMELKPGDRIAFFQAVTQTKQGKQLRWSLPDDIEILRETDALFVIPEGVDVEVTR